jgi:hypothetical protein
MSSPSDRRDVRRSWRRNSKSRDPDAADPGDYVPPKLDTSMEVNSGDFVTSPPKQRGLTTGISTLFRRAASKERGAGSPPVLTSISTSKGGSKGNLDDKLRAVSAQQSKSPGPAQPMGQTTSRLFCNDDSDDSYESRISAISRGREEEDEIDDKRIVRYRGFSTSLQSLFLDESLVCASIGCFGLMLSNRTEYLLEVRNVQRGSESRSKRRSSAVSHRHPSRLIGYILLGTLLSMGLTFIIFGFGSNHTSVAMSNWNDGKTIVSTDDDAAANTDDGAQQAADDANSNNNYDDKAQQNADDANNNDDGAAAGDDGAAAGDDAGNRQLDSQQAVSAWRGHRTVGICKIRDSQQTFWEPFMDFIRDEWKDRPEQRHLKKNKQTKSDAGSTTRSVLALLFLVVLGVVGRRRRMRARYALAKARAQDDALHYASSGSQKILTEEDNYEGACSHTLCGCYPIDPQMDEDEQEEPELDEDGNKRKNQDCVARGFSCLLATCCGFICKCWAQCLSICALAQEGREIRLLVAPKFQRIDYITHQPFSEYQPSVNDLRRGWLGKTRRKAGFLPHIQALSRLSRYILIMFSSTIVVLVVTLMFNPRAQFSWPDAIVLFATFVQSFLVIYVVHWIFHKSDLSMDAVVKYFAAGFLIATPSAFIFEGLLVNIILGIAYTVYSLLEFVCGYTFVNWFVAHYRFVWILGELVNAYVVAAITEELCKYYTFRTVEHPDLIFLTGLNRNHQDDAAALGGIVQYPYGVHQLPKLNRNNSFESMSQYSHRSTKSSRSELDNAEWIKRAATEEEFAEDENDARTFRQKAAALTTGMIGVAVGLACAENFLYVFMLGGTDAEDDAKGGGTMEEWIVLLFRSIFPIHALGAAMQSINMIRKFVECSTDKDHRIGVGRVIMPAVLLHGSFDAVLLGINVYIESAWDKLAQENNGDVEGKGIPYNPLLINLIAWVSITVIMLAGLLWYYRENRNQRQRLILMEEEEKAGLESFDSAKPPVADIELV